MCTGLSIKVIESTQQLLSQAKQGDQEGMRLKILEEILTCRDFCTTRREFFEGRVFIDAVESATQPKNLERCSC
jgi:hypothetical protein